MPASLYPACTAEAQPVGRRPDQGTASRPRLNFGACPGIEGVACHPREHARKPFSMLNAAAAEHTPDMGTALAKPATYEDLLQVPEHRVAEILNGELHTHPRPSPRHARAASALGGKLSDPFDIGRGGPGGWWILGEPEIHLDDQVIVPDLAGWRRERLPALPDSAWIDLAPDWVCEILSASTAKTDRTIKVPLYAIHEVAWLWLIDPTLKTLEAFVLRGGRWTIEATLGDSDTVALPPFEACPFPLSDLSP